jgi:hypothetical protein
MVLETCWVSNAFFTNLALCIMGVLKRQPVIFFGLGKSGTARKVLQYTLHYQRKVQCQDAMRQQLLAVLETCWVSNAFFTNLALCIMGVLKRQPVIFFAIGNEGITYPTGL